MKYERLQDAVRAWVQTFNAIPQGLIEKLLRNDPDELYEITPPGNGDSVYIYRCSANGKYGEIVDYRKSDGKYKIRLSGSEKKLWLGKNEFDVERDGMLPMWGTMWTFGDSCDEEWANGEYIGPHLQEMADCGFRIYEQEDLGIIFGIDGAGYDFYESHWIPLYLARGLHWHDTENAEEITYMFEHHGWKKVVLGAKDSIVFQKDDQKAVHFSSWESAGDWIYHKLYGKAV